MTIWLKRLRARSATLFSEDVGQGLTEYALILALIALVAIVALTFLGGGVADELTTVGSSFPS
ncbi:MAG: Flp family type IVb pilin [Trebonia sp.]